MNIIITGGSRGIGLELTKQALAKGDQVLVVARQAEDSENLKESKRKHESQLHLLSLDVAASDAGEGIAKSASELWPHVDILINNAGILPEGAAPKDFLNGFQINAMAPFFISKTLLPLLKKSSAPKLVQITSQMGSIQDCSSGGSYAYRASKAALNMLNKCLSVENPWLTAIVMHPGWVKTDMGGASAPVAPEESARGIWQVVNRATRDESGEFFNFRGERLPY